MRRFLRALRRWRRGDVLAATAVVLAVGLIATGVSGLLRPPLPEADDASAPVAASAPSDDLPLDLAGHRVRPDGPAPAPSASATPDGQGRFSVPAVHLDVALGAMNETDGVLQPPGFTSAYRVRDLGVAPADAADGTVFVVMHSLRGGGVGPGNALIDVDRGTSSLDTGDDIDVAGIHYRVQQTETVDKTDLPDRADVWADTPGRLVVITCLQRPDGQPSTANEVIEATWVA